MPSTTAAPSRTVPHKKQQITVIPANISNHKYLVSREKEEILVARGMATWIPGTKTLRERTLRARGEQREWRKVSSGRTPKNVPGSLAMQTMQFVVPDDLRVTRSLSTINHSSNRKRIRMSPQPHPPAPAPSSSR